jgi:hypothetical protein
MPAHAAYRASSSMMCSDAGCCLGKDINQRPMGLQQTCPGGAESKVGLMVMSAVI